MKRLLTLALLGLLQLSASLAHAACQDTVIARAVARYSTTGGSQTYASSCTLSVVPARRYLIEVLRPTGGVAGSYARVVYDGVEYFGTDDLGAAGELVSRTIVAKAVATLQITVNGWSGFAVDVRIAHVPEPNYSVMGAHTFTRGSGSPTWQTKNFSYANGVPNGPHTMVIVNGNPDSTLRTQDTEVELNGEQIESRFKLAVTLSFSF